MTKRRTILLKTRFIQQKLNFVLKITEDFFVIINELPLITVAIISEKKLLPYDL